MYVYQKQNNILQYLCLFLDEHISVLQRMNEFSDTDQLFITNALRKYQEVNRTLMATINKIGLSEHEVKILHAYYRRQEGAECNFFYL